MTHLKIEQNNNLEIVDTSIIRKLYNLAKDIVTYETTNNISPSQVDLKGNLLVSKAYSSEVTWLTSNFPELNIAITIASYLTFLDSGIESGLARVYGDGTGVTQLDMAGIVRLRDGLFLNNNVIQSFNELSNFNSITTIGNDTFNGCSNLISIDLSNIEYIGRYAFYGCNLSGTINLPSFRNFIEPSNYYGWRSYAFARNTAITSVTFGENYTGILLQGGIFEGCTNLTAVYGLKINLDNHVFPMYMFNGCSSLTSIGNIDLGHYTEFEDGCFCDCSSLTINLTNPSIITRIGENSFRNVNMGLGQTLELNLTDLHFYPNSALVGTKYKRLILHSPQWTNNNWRDPRYPLYENMRNLEYLDLSDWLTTGNMFNHSEYGDCSFYNNDALVTYIAPLNTNALGTVIGHLGNYSNFRYFILLATTPPTIQTTDHNSPPAYWFYQKGGHVDIYVPDSAKAAYLADTDWATIGGYDGSDTITDRLHGLSELPNGVWTTGLASQYLTPALLATS